MSLAWSTNSSEHFSGNMLPSASNQNKWNCGGPPEYLAKTTADGATTDQEKRYGLYASHWKVLGDSGLSPVAQAQALRKIAKIILLHLTLRKWRASPRWILMLCGKADANTRAAVNGREDISNQVQIPDPTLSSSSHSLIADPALGEPRVPVPARACRGAQ
jgi:hypothetical protein